MEESKAKNTRVVSISGYNPFMNSSLGPIIEGYCKEYGSDKVKIGVVGLHCESTMLFLIYELVTRHNITNVFSCRHLTSSNSEMQHDNSQIQLSSLFGVHFHQSISNFQNSLVFDSGLNMIRKSIDKLQTPLEITKVPPELFDKVKNYNRESVVEISGGRELTKTEEEIVRYLYRNCSEFHLSPLTGGFGPCLVFRVKSKDWYGQQNASSVLKIGTLKTVAREKTNFERVASVLGSSAPSILDYVEMDDKAAIKFAFASMSPDEKVNSFQKVFCSDAPQSEIDRIISITFDHVLGRFYRAGRLEKMNLFDVYMFDGKGWNYRAGGTDTPHLIRERIKKLLKIDGSSKILKFSENCKFRNVADFMEFDLPTVKQNFVKVKPYTMESFVHGDMNGRNILLDGNRNVWLIDFEYTKRTHIIKDTTKLEVDVLFEYTHVEDEKELEQALKITKQLLSIEHLGEELPKKLEGLNKKFQRAWDTVRRLRVSTAKIAQCDRSSLQMNIVMLRYSLFLMTLPQIKHYNRIWALASACGYAEKIVEKMNKNKQLYIKHVKFEDANLGITILPGSRGNEMEKDIEVFKKEKIDSVVMMCPLSKSEQDKMKEMFKKEKIEEVLFCPIPDQSIPALEQGRELVEKIVLRLKQKKNVCLLSVAGLGRCGVIAAAVVGEMLGIKNFTEAIDAVVKVRGTRAIENDMQRNFVKRYFETYLK